VLLLLLLLMPSAVVDSVTLRRSRDDDEIKKKKKYGIDDDWSEREEKEVVESRCCTHSVKKGTVRKLESRKQSRLSASLFVIGDEGRIPISGCKSIGRCKSHTNNS
jgi:hypothetical protein